MEPIESSKTSVYNNTLTPGTYPKEKKLQSKHGESLKSTNFSLLLSSCISTNNCVSCNFIYSLKHKQLRILPSVVGPNLLNFGLVVAALKNV